MSLIKREDLAFKILNGAVYCDSIELAKEFDKKHQDVLKSIRGEIIRHLVDIGKIDKKYLYSESGKEYNITKLSTNYLNLTGYISPVRKHFKEYFVDSTYLTSRGKKNPRFDLTFDGFQLIALGYQGAKARQNKKRFILGFKELLNMVSKNKQIAYDHNENPVWLEFRRQGKEIRTKLTDAINDYLLPQREAENKETSQFVQRYITVYTNLIYKKIGVEIPKGVALNRDAMDMRTLFKIEQLEEQIAKRIKELAEEGMHYKEVYQKIKEE